MAPPEVFYSSWGQMGLYISLEFLFQLDLFFETLADISTLESFHRQQNSGPPSFHIDVIGNVCEYICHALTSAG